MSRYMPGTTRDIVPVCPACPDQHKPETKRAHRYRGWGSQPENSDGGQDRIGGMYPKCLRLIFIQIFKPEHGGLKVQEFYPDTHDLWLVFRPELQMLRSAGYSLERLPQIKRRIVKEWLGSRGIALGPIILANGDVHGD